MHNDNYHLRHISDKMNWSLLHTFLVIVEEKSLSRAAFRLHITQSAVSQSLKKLELQLGQQLIERSNKTFVLTPSGEKCYQAAQAMYQQLALFESQLKQQSAQLSGHLKIQVVSRIHHDAYTEFLHQFKQHHPSVTFDIEVLSSADILRNLSQKIPVLGIALCRNLPDGLNQKLLFNQRYALYCGWHQPLYHASDLSIEQLGKQDFISFQSEQIGSVLSPLTVFKDTHGFTGKITTTTNSLDEVVRLVYAGFGIGCLPMQLGSAPHLQAALKLLPPKDGVADIPVYLLWHQERVLSALEERFIQELMQVDFSMQPNIKLNL